jgi:hypothetical protein
VLKPRKPNKALIGRRFGRLLITEFAYQSDFKHFWTCKCDCGNTIICHTGSLTKAQGKGRTSCGCAPRNNPPTVETQIKRVFYNYCKNAKLRNLEFALTIEDFYALSQKPCYYCGTEKSNCSSTTSVKFLYNGLDRVDNSIGYTLDNCVSCCRQCNCSKLAYSEQQFRDWIGTAYRYQNLKIPDNGYTGI